MNFKLSSHINIEGRLIGKGYPCFIIAEAGVSHFGDVHKAFKLVDLAVDAGADAVKFQIYDVNFLISDDLPDWKQRLGPRQLPYGDFVKIKEYCLAKKIIFFATAHDRPSLDFLNKLNISFYKIGSGELGNWPFIKYIADQKKPVILSTGMYTNSEIDIAIEQFKLANNPDLAILHCVTNYPALPHEIYLDKIKILKNKFKSVIGYSDHTQGFHIPLASIALGAEIIEKHITLDYDIPNAQDWKVSCGPSDFHIFIKQLRDIEETLKLNKNEVNESELKNKYWATKSLVSKREINIGEVLSFEMIDAMRPGNGILPGNIKDILGKKVLFKIPKNKMLKHEYFED